MFNVVLIQNTTGGMVRSMPSYETIEAAKSAAYLELAQIGVSETLVSVKVMVLNDDLQIIMVESNQVSQEVESTEEEIEEA